MTMGAYNSVRVGDLEIAMVLARELRSVSGRPSLTLAQLQQIFGVGHLESAERERIDAALEAAALHAEPSVLDAHPDEALAITVEGASHSGNGHDSGGRRRFARPKASHDAPAAAEAPTEADAPASTVSTSSPPVAAILAGVALPVLLSSVAGWRFGLSFVGFGAVAAGLLLSRPNPGALLRDGRTFLFAVAGLSLLSLLGAVALAGSGSSKSRPAAGRAPAATAPRPRVAPPRATPTQTTPTKTTPSTTHSNRTRRHSAPRPPKPATPSTTPARPSTTP